MATDGGGPQAEGTVRGLLAFLTWSGRKGLMSPKTAAAYKSACMKILEVEPGLENTDIRKLDVSDLVQRFARLRASNYKPESLRTYEQRFASAVQMYADYLKDPRSYRGKDRPRTARQSARTAAPPPRRGPTDRPTAPTEGLVSYPFPLRSGQLAELRLPPDLRSDDARRLCSFITSLAVDDRPALPAADHE